jgi:hypothetical protein
MPASFLEWSMYSVLSPVCASTGACKIRHLVMGGRKTTKGHLAFLHLLSRFGIIGLKRCSARLMLRANAADSSFQSLYKRKESIQPPDGKQSNPISLSLRITSWNSVGPRCRLARSGRKCLDRVAAQLSHGCKQPTSHASLDCRIMGIKIQSNL